MLTSESVSCPEDREVARNLKEQPRMERIPFVYPDGRLSTGGRAVRVKEEPEGEESPEEDFLLLRENEIW